MDIGLFVLVGTGTHGPDAVLPGIVNDVSLVVDLDVDAAQCCFHFWHKSRNFQDVKGIPIDL